MVSLPLIWETTFKEKHLKASYFLFVVTTIKLADLGKVMRGTCPRPASWRDLGGNKDTEFSRMKTV